MDYQKHYTALIERAKVRTLIEHSEKHHILPKCMGGTDSPDNLAILTPEEHYVAHQLLVKIYPDNRKLLWALNAFTRSNYKCVRNNKMYGWIRKKCSLNISGEGNPGSKIKDKDVLNIYFSTLPRNELSHKYNAGPGQISEIKRKISYRHITKDISRMPGCANTGKGCNQIIPIDMVPVIYLEEGSFSHFKEKYNISRKQVISLKNRKLYRRYTENLGEPGQVKRYNLTYDMVVEIFEAEGDNRDIAAKYGIHYNTVRNIKGKYSRAYNIWENF